MNPILDMILEGAPYGAVADAVSAALATLFERDTHLFAVDANERSITHRLAVHLAPHFPGWDIDCEYNRGLSLEERIAQQFAFVHALVLKEKASKKPADEPQAEVGTEPQAGVSIEPKDENQISPPS